EVGGGVGGGGGYGGAGGGGVAGMGGPGGRATKPGEKTNPPPRRAGHIDRHRAVDDVLRLPRLHAGKDEHGADQDRPGQCHDTAMRMCSLLPEEAGSANAARCASGGYLNGSSPRYRTLADILLHFI